MPVSRRVSLLEALRDLADEPTPTLVCWDGVARPPINFADMAAYAQTRDYGYRARFEEHYAIPGVNVGLTPSQRELVHDFFMPGFARCHAPWVGYR